MKRRMAFPGLLVFFALGMASGAAHADMTANLDLRVQQISFTPARAHVGDTIQITVKVANMGDSGVNQTIPAQVLANGKVVASQLFTWGSDPGVAHYTVQFQWDTRKAAPGDYRIKADFSFFSDSNPGDNYLTAEQSLILVPAGAPFPDGQPAGATGR
jgi:hypothetical protein